MGSDSVDRPWLRFVLRYVEITLVLVVGMMLLSMAVAALRTSAGFSYPVGARAAMASVEMGVIMTVLMILWLRIFRFGWPTTLELSATMLIPALVAAALTQTGVIGIGPAMIFEHVAMFVLMLAVMLRRRGEFMVRRGARKHAESS
jgi:hypothetical protein